MSKEIIIKFAVELSDDKMRIISEYLLSIVAPIDPTWSPFIKSDSPRDRSYQIDKGNNWFLVFKANTAFIQSRYGSDELMDAIGTVLMYRLPTAIGWSRKLVDR